jgi:formate hydrogenlyase transcriptional activator
LRERTPLIFSKHQIQDFEAEIAKNFLAEGFRSLCCVPLVRPKGALGVLVLGSTRAHAFQPEDLTLLNQVATQLAVGLENQRTAAEIEALRQRLAEERKYLQGEIRSEGRFTEIVGDSPALKQVLDQVATVAPSEASVLILGETGTGKELVARAVHRLGRRKDGAFIKVNCAAIPTGLLESELFGHEKGAFTGAISQKIGRMELADGGTLFLDEVGEIPLELQPKLLRVLQDQEFERLGSNRTIKVNLRLVAATNRDLAKGMAEHEFRSDLFYRLSVFPIRVPPLRERREDIPLLIRYFVHKFALRMDRHIETIPKETMKALTEWSWPGNVRELENLMERSVILSDGNALRVPLVELRGEPRAAAAQPASTPDHSLDNAERQHILRILRETHGVLSGPDGAAHRLGLKRTTLQSKMQRLKITRHDYMGS